MLPLTRLACAAGLLITTFCGPAPCAPDASAPADAYTGVIIDARAQTAILRSPAPTIVGPGPDWTLVYPDRSHVPTPDEVQDESIVRYYHTEAEAEKGVGGPHPLIIPASAVIGYAKDGVQVNAADVQRLLDADKSLHFTQTWRVGFLVPDGH